MTANDTIFALKAALELRVQNIREKPVTKTVIARMQRVVDGTSIMLRQTDRFRNVAFCACVDDTGDIQVTLQE